jgi:hypothetical protein
VDVSLCNVVGAGGDFVFMPHRGVVYAMMKPIPFQMFASINILTILMVVTLARNLEVSLGESSESASMWLTMCMMVALLFLVLFANGSGDALAPYITLEDRFAFVVVVAYVCYYVLRMAIDLAVAYIRSYRTGKPLDLGNPSPINPVIGTLILVAMRLHSTLDNPYSTVGAFLLSTRLLHKLSDAEGMLRMSMDVLIDASLLSIVVYAGVVPQNDRNPTIAGLFLLQGLFAATTLNRVVIGFREQTAVPVKVKVP